MYVLLNGIIVFYFFFTHFESIANSTPFRSFFLTPVFYFLAVYLVFYIIFVFLNFLNEQKEEDSSIDLSYKLNIWSIVFFLLFVIFSESIFLYIPILNMAILYGGFLWALCLFFSFVSLLKSVSLNNKKVFDRWIGLFVLLIIASGFYVNGWVKPDYLVCSFVTHKTGSTQCVSDVAIQRKDLAYCAIEKEAGRHDYCVKSIVGKNPTIEQCNMYRTAGIDMNNKSVFGSCFFLIAESTKDEKLCELSSHPDGCVSYIAYLKKDPEICNLIKSGTDIDAMKEKCKREALVPGKR